MMVKQMAKTALLCSSGCCPMVVVDNDKVQIGEEGNICTLRKDEWNALVDKVLTGELSKL